MRQWAHVGVLQRKASSHYRWSLNWPEGQIWQVGAYLLIIDARTLVTTERDLEKAIHVVVWESHEWWG